MGVIAAAGEGESSVRETKKSQPVREEERISGRLRQPGVGDGTGPWKLLAEGEEPRGFGARHPGPWQSSLSARDRDNPCPGWQTEWIEEGDWGSQVQL